MLGYTECDVKAAIEAGLTSSGGYATRRYPDTYDEALAPTVGRPSIDPRHAFASRPVLAPTVSMGNIPR